MSFERIPDHASALRSLARVNANNPRGKSAILMAAASLVIFGAFGTFVALAGDDTGVHEFIRSQTRSAFQPRQHAAALPSLFVPHARSNRALSYAPHDSDAPRYTPRDAGRQDRVRLEFDPRVGRKSRDSGGDSSRGKGLNHSVAYCVRLCDGFYFPVDHEGSDDKAGLQQTCNSLCPTSETKLFIAPRGSDGIELASAGGKLYTSLPQAYSHRTSYNKSCTCNAAGYGLQTLALDQDKTLRRGDVVATRLAPRVFAGGAQLPHREREFVPLARAQSLSNAERRQVSSLFRAPPARAPFIAVESERRAKSWPSESSSFRPVLSLPETGGMRRIEPAPVTLTRPLIRYVGPVLSSIERPTTAY